MDGSLVEVVELPGHPWFISCQFHPEFTSNPRDGHRLFTGFLKAAIRKSSESLSDDEIVQQEVLTTACAETS